MAPPDLSQDQLALLTAIATSTALYMVEDGRAWGEDGADVTASARAAEELAAAGLVLGIGQYFDDDGPGVYTLFEVTGAGLAVLSELKPQA